MLSEKIKTTAGSCNGKNRNRNRNRNRLDQNISVGMELRRKPFYTNKQENVVSNAFVMTLFIQSYFLSNECFQTFFNYNFILKKHQISTRKQLTAFVKALYLKKLRFSSVHIIKITNFTYLNLLNSASTNSAITWQYKGKVFQQHFSNKF